jgi:hypothetical protein
VAPRTRASRGLERWTDAQLCPASLDLLEVGQNLRCCDRGVEHTKTKSKSFSCFSFSSEYIFLGYCMRFIGHGERDFARLGFAVEVKLYDLGWRRSKRLGPLSYLANRRLALVPPKPNELDMTACSSFSCGWFGT